MRVLVVVAAEPAACDGVVLRQAVEESNPLWPRGAVDEESNEREIFLVRESCEFEFEIWISALAVLGRLARVDPNRAVLNLDIDLDLGRLDKIFAPQSVKDARNVLLCGFGRHRTWNHDEKRVRVLLGVVGPIVTRVQLQMRDRLENSLFVILGLGGLGRIDLLLDLFGIDWEQGQHK